MNMQTLFPNIRTCKTGVVSLLYVPAYFNVPATTHASHCLHRAQLSNKGHKFGGIHLTNWDRPDINHVLERGTFEAIWKQKYISNMTNIENIQGVIIKGAPQ